MEFRCQPRVNFSAIGLRREDFRCFACSQETRIRVSILFQIAIWWSAWWWLFYGLYRASFHLYIYSLIGNARACRLSDVSFPPTQSKLTWAIVHCDRISTTLRFFYKRTQAITTCLTISNENRRSLKFKTLNCSHPRGILTCFTSIALFWRKIPRSPKHIW